MDDTIEKTPNRILEILITFLILGLSLAIVQAQKDSDPLASAARGKPSPTPTPTPPPVDTRCFVGAGCIDLGFGSGGRTILPGEALEDAATQPDGKIVAVGHGPGTAGLADSIIVRLNPDGTRDTGFGDVDPQNPLLRLGYRYDDVDMLSNRARSMAIQPDGRILVGGIRVSNGQVYATVVRLLDNGDRDLAFGSGGVLRLNIVGAVVGMAVQGNGKIVIATYYHVARFNSDGLFDTTFGGTGLIETRSRLDSLDMALQTINGEERIVLGGYRIVSAPKKGKPGNTRNDFTIVRLLPNGTVDPSFGTSGQVDTSFGYTDSIHSLAIDGNNRIVASGLVGTAGPQAAGFARYLADGTPDVTFAGTGRTLVQVNGYRTTSMASVVQADGKIVSFGYNETATSTNLCVIRLNSDGSPDVEFGPGTLGAGIATWDITGSTEFGLGGTLDLDGGIIAVGYANQNLFAARYIP